MTPETTDKELYEKIKKEITAKYKPSAYRSGLMVKQYKEEYFRKHKNYNAYTGSKENSNLGRWFREEWKNQLGEVGYKKKGDIYRPTKKISDKTPITFGELTHNQIIRAMNEKLLTGRVRKF